MKLTPAEYIISQFGGVRSAAKILGISITALSHWQTRRPVRGNKGMIPSYMQKKILKEAKRLKLDIDSYDVIYGRNVTKRLPRKTH